MAAPQITPLPTPPVRSDAPADFSSKADAFVAALPGFATQANAQADYNEARATASDASATASAVSAGESAGYAGDSAASAASALASEQAADATAANLASLDALWLGAATSDPATGKAGAPLVAGNAYVNSVTGLLRAYNGTEWVQGVSVVAGVSAVAGLVGDITLEQLNTVIRPRTQARILSFF